jgi:hypothetical protein
MGTLSIPGPFPSQPAVYSSSTILSSPAPYPPPFPPSNYSLITFAELARPRSPSAAPAQTHRPHTPFHGAPTHEEGVYMSLLPAPSTRLLRREVDGVEKRLHVAYHSGARALDLATPQSSTQRLDRALACASACDFVSCPPQPPFARSLTLDLAPAGNTRLVFAASLSRSLPRSHVRSLPRSRTRSTLMVNAYAVWADGGVSSLSLCLPLLRLLWTLGRNAVAFLRLLERRRSASRSRSVRAQKAGRGDSQKGGGAPLLFDREVAGGASR